jgi:hypothetical protein
MEQGIGSPRQSKILYRKSGEGTSLFIYPIVIFIGMDPLLRGLLLPWKE